MTRKMKDSGIEWIGEIPEEWEVLPARYFFKANKKIVGHKENEYERLSLTMKGVLKKSKYNSEGLQPSNFNSYQILTKNQLVFKLIDLQNVSTSRVGISPYKGLVSPAYIIIDRKDTKTNNRFYYYWYMSMYLNKVFNLLGDAGVRSNINATELLELKVPRTNFREQNIISDFLDKKTEQIENTKSTILQEIQTLEAYKKSVITEAVTKGLDKNVEMKDSGIEWIGEIPKSWKVTKVKYIGKLQNGISKNAKYFGKGYPFISYGDVYKNNSLPDEVNGLVESTFSEQALYSVKKGDVFFTRTSETLEEIGYSSVSLKNFEKATFAGFLIRLRPYKSSAILPNYSKYYFRSEHLREYLAKEMTIVTRASLGQQLLNDMVVLLPNIEEQKIIINYLDKKCKLIDDLIAIKKKQLEILEEYKKSLIYEYVTGKKEVKDGEET